MLIVGVGLLEKFHFCAAWTKEHLQNGTNKKNPCKLVLSQEISKPGIAYGLGWHTATVVFAPDTSKRLSVPPLKVLLPIFKQKPIFFKHIHLDIRLLFAVFLSIPPKIRTPARFFANNMARPGLSADLWQHAGQIVR